MGRGLTAGTILAGIALLAYIFTRQGRAVGDRGLSYVQGALAGVQADEDPERKDGEAGATEPEGEPPAVAATPDVDPTPGPPANAEGGSQSGQVIIEDDDPQPGAVEASGQDQDLNLDAGGERGVVPDVTPDVEPTPTPTPSPRPAPPTTGREANRQLVSYLKTQGIDPGDYHRKYGGVLTKYYASFGRAAPAPKTQAAATRPTGRVDPAKKAEEARLVAAYVEGRSQAATPGTRSVAPTKPGLSLSREEILAKVAGYFDEERGL